MNKKLSALPVILFLFTNACQNQTNPQPSSSPSVTSSPSVVSSPVTSSSPQPLINTKTHSGCYGSLIVCAEGQPCAVPSCPSTPPPAKAESPLFIEESNYENIKTKFSLFGINRAQDYLGGLNPSYPIAEGLKSQCNDNEGLHFNGGKLRSCSSLIIEKTPGNFEQINNLDSLAKTFAPIDSEAEAISYLSLATNTKPIFTFDLKDNYRYYQNFIEPTTTSKTDNGYTINMFYFQTFGCGPHGNYEVKFSISKDGQVKELSRKLIYEDPEQDNLCVD